MRHDRHDYRLHLLDDEPKQPEPRPVPGYEHWGLTNTTRQWPSPQEEAIARPVVIVCVLIGAVIFAVCALHTGG